MKVDLCIDQPCLHLSAMPSFNGGPTVTARILSGLDDFLATKGLDAREHLRRAGIDPAMAADPDAFLNFYSVIGLFEAIAVDCNDEAFGLHYAEFLPLYPIGLFHYVTVNSPNLREALEVSANLSSLVVSAYAPQFEIRDGIGYFEWAGIGQLGPARQFFDYAVMMLVGRCRYMLQDSAWMPMKVSFHHSTPRSTDEFVRLFGPQLEFQAALTCVQFDSGSLRRVLPQADPTLYRELKVAAGRMSLAPVEPTSTTGKVRKYLQRSLARADVADHLIARALGMSERTLQRKLAEEGTSLRALIDDARRKAAARLLFDTDLPLTEIAFLLGFSELSAFSRAARIWFGESPSAVRLKSRGGKG